jgi:hypothetical protein
MNWGIPFIQQQVPPTSEPSRALPMILSGRLSGRLWLELTADFMSSYQTRSYKGVQSI